jgi:hypothetical protein
VAVSGKGSGHVSIAGLVCGRDSLTVSEAVISAVGSLPASIKRSLTWDCGSEMALHKDITATGLPVFFAHPHPPWERGSNENLNRIVREYLPKGSRSPATRTAWPRSPPRSTTDHVRSTTGANPARYSPNSSKQMLPPPELAHRVSPRGDNPTTRPHRIDHRLATTGEVLSHVVWRLASSTRSHPTSDSNRTPLTVPPHASADCTAATDRALPCPPADGISARRQASVFASSASTGGSHVPRIFATGRNLEPSA